MALLDSRHFSKYFQGYFKTFMEMKFKDKFVLVQNIFEGIMIFS